MGGSIAFTNERAFDRPTSTAEWAIVESRGWAYDAMHSRTATQILFANYVGYPTNVDDSDIDELVSAVKQLPEINQIRLDATRISRDGMERMRTELPHITISNPRYEISNKVDGEPSDAQKDRASRFDNGESTSGPR